MHTFILLTKFTKRWQPTLSPLHCSKLAFSFQQSIVDFVILTNDDLYICLVTTCLDMVSHFDHVSQSTPVTCLRLTTHPRLLLAVRCATWWDQKQISQNFNFRPLDKPRKKWFILTKTLTKKSQRRFQQRWRWTNELGSSYIQTMNNKQSSSL